MTSSEVGTYTRAGLLPLAPFFNDPLLAALGDSFPVFQLHGETVELTDGMTLLAQGAYSRNQIVKVAERAYGTQSHVELTPEMLAIWTAQDHDLADFDESMLQKELDAIAESYNEVGITLINNFLTLAGLTEPFAQHGASSRSSVKA